MANNIKWNINYFAAIILAIWFMLTSSFWVYLFNVFLSFPAALISLLLWWLGKKHDENLKRYRYVIIILGIGVVFSIMSFILLSVLDK
ncbi:MAG: hypothetical protein NXI20_01755 [bacterium]|nr:hypothetical protein [bacterium]